MARVIILLTTLYIIVLLPTGRFISVGGSSEAREIHIARTIAESGEWLLPSRNGIPPSKPPLYHWVCAGISKITNHPVSPTITRGVNVISALLIVLMVIGFGVKNRILNTPNQIALFGLITSTTHVFLNSSVDSKVDMFAALWITAALLSFNNSNKLFFSTSLALAILSKGPVCAILIALGILSFTEFKIEKVMQVAKSWIFPSIAGVALGLSWYSVLFVYGDSATLERQMFFENINRFFGGENINEQPWWYYISEFLTGGFPWSILFFASFFIKLKSTPLAASSRRFFILGLIFFSISSGKRASYLIPLIPWISLYLTEYSIQFWKRMSDRSQGILLKFSRSTSLVLLTIFLLLIPGIELLTRIDFDSPSNHIASVWISHHELNLGLILLFGLILSYAFRRFLILILLTVFFTGWTFVNATSEGIKAALKDFERAAVSVKNHLGNNSLIVAKKRADELLDPIMYYIGLPAKVQTEIPTEGIVLMKVNYANKNDSTCKLIESYQQIPDKEKNRTDRLIGLYNCGQMENHIAEEPQKAQ